jgi:hypothetical protein
MVTGCYEVSPSPIKETKTEKPRQVFWAVGVVNPSKSVIDTDKVRFVYCEGGMTQIVGESPCRYNLIALGWVDKSKCEVVDR